MDYKHFKDIFERTLTVDSISQAIGCGTGTVLCSNEGGYYIDNLDDYFGEDDTVEVPTELAEQVIAQPGVSSMVVRGVKVFMIS